jgi:hypothetical protein
MERSILQFSLSRPQLPGAPSQQPSLKCGSQPILIGRHSCSTALFGTSLVPSPYFQEFQRCLLSPSIRSHHQPRNEHRESVEDTAHPYERMTVKRRIHEAPQQHPAKHRCKCEERRQPSNQQRTTCKMPMMLSQYFKTSAHYQVWARRTDICEEQLSTLVFHTLCRLLLYAQPAMGVRRNSPLGGRAFMPPACLSSPGVQ